MNGKTVAGLALIVGAVVFLFGGDLGGFFAFLLSVGLLVFGWRKWKRSESSGGRAVGIGALIFGAILLLSWIPFLIGLLIAVVCIYFGWTLIRQLNSTLDVRGMGPQFDWLAAEADELHARDRSFFYRALRLGRKR